MAYPPGAQENDATNNTAIVNEHPDRHNAVADAVNTIVAELGTGPKGGSADLTARLSALDTTVGGLQPLDSDLTAIAALTTTAYGRSLLEAANAAGLRTLAGLGTAATSNTGDFDAAGAAAAAQAASQPLDSDLTAIAALTTTAFGRALLALADASALRTAAGVPFATPAVVLGTAAATGSADSVIRSDATLLAFDATAPVTQAFSDAAAAGVAAVAARRDHKHGMPSSPFALIATQSVVGSSTTVVTFSSIPGTYSHLRLYGTSRTDRAAVPDFIALTVNGDTAGHYQRGRLAVTGSVGGSSGSNSSFDELLTAGASEVASIPGFMVVDFPLYAATTFFKTWESRSFVASSTTANTAFRLQTVTWISTAAITSITLTSELGSNYIAGSTFALYGVV